MIIVHVAADEVVRNKYAVVADFLIELQCLPHGCLAALTDGPGMEMGFVFVLLHISFGVSEPFIFMARHRLLFLASVSLATLSAFVKRHMTAITPYGYEADAFGAWFCRDSMYL